MKTLTQMLLAASLTLAAVPVFAQAPPPPMAPMHHAMHPNVGNATAPLGQIIGNKRTHVFHVAGDHGSLPAPQNRVIFHSTAEATAAGYHAAGHGAPKSAVRNAMPRMHGAPRLGTPGAAGRPMPPPPVPLTPR